MSSRRFLSSAACASASFTIRSTSSRFRPDEPLIVIFCSCPVATSFADTLTMPLASMSNATSICGTPRGAVGRPTRWNRPRVRLSLANWRSPWSTCTSTLVWLSVAVEKISLLRVGMVVLRVMSGVITPPSVSMPSDSGGHVEQQDVLDLALQHPALDRGADGDDFIRVDALVRLLAEELLHQ